jgi:hypothetical protein
MKANRAFRSRDEEAGAEVVGALVLFGIFVATIAFLNATAVPQAAGAAEQEHYQHVFTTINTLHT